VLSDSIRITAHAAIPVLSFITAPEEAASELAEAEDAAAPPGGRWRRGGGKPPRQNTRQPADLVRKEHMKTVAKLLVVLTRLTLTSAAELREITGMLRRTVL
ncbi:unnamed protein product, partial [Prorocentrum cordatum]